MGISQLCVMFVLNHNIYNLFVNFMLILTECYSNRGFSVIPASLLRVDEIGKLPGEFRD